MEQAALRNAAREARLAAPSSSRTGFRTDGTPSPAASEHSGALPFQIPLQPMPKAGRSMSHSQGQREMVPVPSDSTALPLGLLSEEVDTESESELGGGLTHTTSHPPIGTLQRTTTLPSSYEYFYGGANGKESLQAGGGAQANLRGDQRFEASFGQLSLDPPPRRAQWQSKLGWDDVPSINESRRHSLADIPTRRGSLVGIDNRPSFGGMPYWSNGDAYEWDGRPNGQNGRGVDDDVQLLQFGHGVANQHNNLDPSRRSDDFEDMKYHDRDAAGMSFTIPDNYKVPFVQIEESERNARNYRPLPPPSKGKGRDALGRRDDDEDENMVVTSYLYGPSVPNKPRKLLFMVSFKCSRVEVFFLLENTGLNIKEGDIVIVEADRGQDLGTVQHANVTEEEARIYRKKYNDEQYKWLMMFSKNNSQNNVNPNAQVYGQNRNLLANAPPTLQGPARENFNQLKPKAIKRLASSHEIHMLSEKEANEAKAKRTCQQRAAHLRLDMEILDAEWQWDFQKIIFYYYADHYINFKDLITELYRIYKARIWLSAINPASFSQHALGQPPSGIGPGAIVPRDPHAGKNALLQAFNTDPDPHGAVRPYTIPYDTYTPNYPQIPGITNSFPEGKAQQSVATNSGGDQTPGTHPHIVPTGTMADYDFYYLRTTPLPLQNLVGPVNPALVNPTYPTFPPAHASPHQPWPPVHPPAPQQSFPPVRPQQQNFAPFSMPQQNQQQPAVAQPPKQPASFAENVQAMLAETASITPLGRLQFDDCGAPIPGLASGLPGRRAPEGRMTFGDFDSFALRSRVGPLGGGVSVREPAARPPTTASTFSAALKAHKEFVPKKGGM